MEKTLTPDERIKRAEEIYYKKKIQNTNKKSARVNVSKEKEFGMLKRMSFQIIICIVIYAIFYMIQNTNCIFSEDVIKKVNDILSYDINIKNIYEQGINYINNFSNDEEGIVVHSQEENLIETNSNNENLINENVEIKNIDSVEQENIGGENVEVNVEEPVELTQMEQDAKDILETKSLIIPLKGTITSRFGVRNPETLTVPKNHTGIDIAVNEGTIFIASMEGLVEEVSSERRFRKTL